jgi:hypothetical protein
MGKKTFLKEIQPLLKDMEIELRLHGYSCKLKGGLKQKGFTGHDVDLEIKMPSTTPPSEEVFVIINGFGNELWKKFGLLLDIDFCFEKEPVYKFDDGGFFEYQEDGSLEPFSPL